MQRVKGYREKTGTALYSNLIPFGTDGVFVDMNSGLNLEEDILIGGNHYTTIQESSDTTTVINETFAKKEDVENEVAENYYVKNTLIDESTEDTVITIKLFLVKDSTVSPVLLREKVITIDGSGAVTEIEEVLEE